MLKRIFSLILAAFVTLAITIPSFASMQAPLIVEFNEFKFTTNDYNPMEVKLEHADMGLKEQVTIRDRATNEILEVLVVEKNATRAVGPYIFTRSKSYGATTVQLSVQVELYTEGSFRQINAVTGSYLGITTSVAPTEIEDKTVSVWSSNDVFPTAEVMYAYSGTLVATVESSMSAEVSAELMGSGFSLSEQVNGTTFYRRSMDSTGTISVY